MARNDTIDAIRIARAVEILEDAGIRVKHYPRAVYVEGRTYPIGEVLSSAGFRFDRQRGWNRPIRGYTTAWYAEACRALGRPLETDTAAWYVAALAKVA